MVKFEKIDSYKNNDFPLPVRKTGFSAGYDFTVPEDVMIPSHYLQLVKMLKEKFTNEETLIRAGDLPVMDKLISLEKTFLFKSETAQKEIVTRLIMEELPTIADFLKNEMTLDLQEMEELTKVSNTRMTLVPTGVKAKLKDNQKLELMIRSSCPLKSYLLMANSIGLIDADYYNNEGNEGHIYFQLLNLSPFNIQLKKGDVIGQGIISEYQTTTDDKTDTIRKGGLGSTTIKKEV